jgi:hypothetical protein
MSLISKRIFAAAIIAIASLGLMTGCRTFKSNALSAIDISASAKTEAALESATEKTLESGIEGKAGNAEKSAAAAEKQKASDNSSGDKAGNNPSNSGSDNSSNSESVNNMDLSVLLGRPTDSSITLNILSQSNTELSIIYGVSLDNPDRDKSGISVKAGTPAEIDISDLQSDTQYYYAIEYEPENNSELQPVLKGSFHTARQVNSSFTFAIEADPHLDEQSDPEVYRQALTNMLSDNPDFLVDLGDIFMTDKLTEKSEGNIENRYLLFRDFFSLIGPSIPLFLTLGNHEGEAGWDLNNNTSKLAIFSRSNRLSYYSNPYPDDFYSGNIQKENGQYPEDYYSFNWGDGLFIMLDPYMYTENKPGENGWEWTLGKEQYGWLQETLENSTAKYKFVFIHQLVGGDTQGRGGVEFADLFEWGGNNSDGTYGFDSNRPGWGKPIHQLLVDNNVDVVFKGHDHFFAKQELDGIIYQTLPQPSHPGEKINTAEEYGYLSGEILGGSGYLLIVVSDSKTTIEFIKANNKKEIVYSYDII